jgi:capsid protein
MLTVKVVGDTFIAVAGGCVTVIALVAERFVPSAVRAVIVEVPAATPVTRPVAFTVATAGLLDVHVTVWEAFVGDTVDVSCCGEPM